MKDKSKVFIDLSKCSEDELKSLPEIIEKSKQIYFEDRMFLKNGKYDKQYLHYHNGMNQWISANILVMKTEISLQDFKELFVSEEDNNGWIKINSESDLPDFNKWVIAHTKDGANHIAYFDKRRNEWVANSKFGDEITHWRHEPEPPKF